MKIINTNWCHPPLYIKLLLFKDSYLPVYCSSSLSFSLFIPSNHLFAEKTVCPCSSHCSFRKHSVRLSRIDLCALFFSQASADGILDASAVQFCARKVSAVSGDARKALDICR